MSFTELSAIWRWQGDHVSQAHDELAIEQPLEIRVRGRAVSVTMRTPGHDAELAAGFLLTEGVVRRRADILAIDPCRTSGEPEAGDRIHVRLAAEVPVDFARLTRHVFASSSCGLCGKATIEAIHRSTPPILDAPVVSAAVIRSLPQRMRRTQAAFDRTGGLHAAAVFDENGRLIVLREDVGRHNAVDKVIGWSLLEQTPLQRHILLVSGRASFEIMQKALAGGFGIVAAISAPTSLAVEFARDSGQTLIGFLRDRRMNVYTCPHRITEAGGGRHTSHGLPHGPPFVARCSDATDEEPGATDNGQGVRGACQS